MEGNTEATAHPIAEPNGHPPDFNVGGSAEAAALPSIGGDDRPVGIAMEDLTYNRHEPKTLTVRGLHYEVETKGLEWWQALSSFQLPWGEGGCCHKGATQSKREVLHNVSFEVKSGEMLAVLGSSGSGKTSLIDVIACNHSGGDVSGEVFIDGRHRTRAMIRESAACVRQDDRLLPHLTVKETLSFVAQLKLPANWTSANVAARVDSVISELGLRHVAHSKVGGEQVRGISGGERRRVSIGIQLLLDPCILFLDEPTSGLDSFTAHHLMETLAKLARNNRIVMLSIHQPRSDIFALFDLIMLLSQGHMVYYGKAANMVDYFTSLGHPCPELTNPCDFYVDLTTVDMKTLEREYETAARVQQLVSNFLNVSQDSLLDDEVQGKLSSSEPSRDHQSIDLNPQTSKSYTNPAFQNDDEEGEVPLDCVGNAAGQSRSLPAEGTSSASEDESVSLMDLEKPGLLKQFSVLLRRASKNNLEDYGFLGVQAVEALAMSVMIGLVFFDLKLDQLSARDRFGLLYIIGALYPYMVILDVISKYYKERFTIYFEMKDGLYGAFPYFWAKVVSEIPEHLLFIILYSVPVYFLSGMQTDPSLFFQAFAVIFLVVYNSRCIGQFAGALMPTYPLAVLTAQSIFTMFLLSSGFIFNLENLFVGTRWISYLSHLKWGYQALCVLEFTNLNFTCPEALPDVCLNTGEEALKAYSLDGHPVWHSVCIIATEIGVFSTLYFICIRFISQKPHQT